MIPMQHLVEEWRDHLALALKVLLIPNYNNYNNGINKHKRQRVLKHLECRNKLLNVSRCFLRQSNAISLKTISNKVVLKVCKDCNRNSKIPLNRLKLLCQLINK